MSNCGRELNVLGGGAAVTKDKSITTLPSTNSPPNTRTQTNSTASANAARGRLDAKHGISDGRRRAGAPRDGRGVQGERRGDLPPGLSGGLRLLEPIGHPHL